MQQDATSRPGIRCPVGPGAQPAATPPEPDPGGQLGELARRTQAALAATTDPGTRSLLLVQLESLRASNDDRPADAAGQPTPPGARETPQPKEKPMQDTTTTDNNNTLEAKALAAAQARPLLMATWLIADAAGSLATRVQEGIEVLMRDTVGAPAPPPVPQTPGARDARDGHAGSANQPGRAA